VSINPSTGTYWAPGTKAANSYPGILAAINDLRVSSQSNAKDYPDNFAGIIQAIKDLDTSWGNASVGETPPGWTINTDSDGNIVDGQYSYEPNEGQLWFDTRQGRLFIYVDDDFYQTNGSDGLTHVGTSAPQYEVIGAQWYNNLTNLLYVYDGSSWNVVNSGGTMSSNDLTITSTTISYLATLTNPYVTAYTPSGTATQASYNSWTAQAINEVEIALKALDDTPLVTSNGTAPSSPANGDLWFKTPDNHLYVRSGTQWVNTTASTSTALQTNINTLQTSTNTEVARLDGLITTINSSLSGYATTANLTSTENNLQGQITTLSNTVGDVNRFALTASVNPTLTDHGTRIASLETNVTNLTNGGFATTTYVTNAINTLESTINISAYATTAFVNTQIANTVNQIPDVSTKLDTSTFTSYQTTAASTFLAKAGGTMTNTLSIQKTDTANAAIDLSADYIYGVNALKFKTKTAGSDFVVFGSFDNDFFEYAWSFGSNEDFCWKHSTNGKVFSVNKEGPACEKLYIGTFGTNNSNGRVMTGSYELTAVLQSIKAAAQDASTDLAGFKAAVVSALASV
tara:strand:- start:684 stop:2399 length:1716 start_codon:yes stop_codon:yes gene_type:complete